MFNSHAHLPRSSDTPSHCITINLVVGGPELTRKNPMPPQWSQHQWDDQDDSIDPTGWHRFQNIIQYHNVAYVQKNKNISIDIAIALSDAEVKHSISLAEAFAIELAHELAGHRTGSSTGSVSTLIRYELQHPDGFHPTRITRLPQHSAACIVRNDQKRQQKPASCPHRSCRLPAAFWLWLIWSICEKDSNIFQRTATKTCRNIREIKTNNWMTPTLCISMHFGKVANAPAEVEEMLSRTKHSTLHCRSWWVRLQLVRYEQKELVPLLVSAPRLWPMICLNFYAKSSSLHWMKPQVTAGNSTFQETWGTNSEKNHYNIIVF